MGIIGRNSPCPCGSSKKYKRCCDGIEPAPSPVHPTLPQGLGNTLSLSWMHQVSLEEILQRFFGGHESRGHYEKWVKSNQSDIELDIIKAGANEVVFSLVLQSSGSSIAIQPDGILKISKSQKMSTVNVVCLFWEILNSAITPTLSEENNLIVQTIRTLYGRKPGDRISFVGPLITIPDMKSKIKECGSQSLFLRKGFELPTKFSSKIQNPTIVMNRLQDRLSSKIHSMRYPQENVLDKLEFVFSDNTSLTVDEIIFHPYFLLLPESITILFETSGWYYAHSNFKYFVNLQREYDSSTMPALCDGILKSLACVSEEIKCFITDKSRTSFQEPARKVLEFNGFDILYANDLSIRFSSQNERLNFQITTPHLDLESVRTGRFLYSDSAQKFNFISFTGWEDDLLSIQDITYQLESIVRNGVVACGSIPQFTQRTFYQLKYNLNLFQLKSDYSSIQQLPPEQFKFGVELFSDKKYEISLAHDSVFAYWNGMNHIYALNSGLGDAFSEDNKNLAIHTGEKRKFDLKFLRHQGLYLLLISEFIKSLVNNEKKLNTAEIIETVHAFFDIVVKNSSLDENDKNQNRCTSKKIDQLLKKWLKTIQEDFSEKIIICENGQIFQTPFSIYGQKFFEFFLLLIQDQLTPKQLLKEKNSTFKIISYDGRFTFNINDGFTKALNVIDSTVEVKVDGNPIAILTEDDFKTILSIDESQGGNEWFSLHPQVFFDGKEIPLEEALRFARDRFVIHEGKTYTLNSDRIPALKWLDYFWQRLKGESSGKKNKSSSELFFVPKSQILTLLAMKNAGLPVIGGEKWKDISRNFDELSHIDKSVEAEKIKKALSHIPLRPFQVEGVLWLSQITGLGLGGILADDMGLGKTIQTLAFLSLTLKSKQHNGPKLIVVPTSLIYNWQKECEKFTPELKMILFNREMKTSFTPSMNDSIVLTTYGLLTEHSEFFESIQWSMVVFDEAQNLKNISSQRATTARKLTAAHKIALTGTPMENHYGEYFSLIDLILPGTLGDHTSFNKRYVYSRPSATDMEFLKLVTKPLILRRQKKLILSELPSKTESLIKLDFEEKQKDIYRDVAIAWNDNIKQLIDQKGESKSQIEMLTALLRLRQLCSYPQLVPDVKYLTVAPKETELLGQVEEIVSAGESILIFTHFKGTLDRICNRLKEEGLKFWAIHGGVSAQERKNILTEFDQYEGGGIIVMTLKTGGVGLNLTKASYVIHFEPWWNPAVENQATDRSHRMSQTKSVQVYRYLMKESVEERMEDLKSTKKKAFNMLFDDALETESTEIAADVKIRGGLSKADFDYLLGAHA